MRTALTIVAGIVLLAFLAVAFVLPSMQGAEERGAAAALIAGTEPAKQQVAAAAEKTGSLVGAGGGVKVAPRTDTKYGEMTWIVEKNGVIRGWNEKNAIEISFKPTLAGGKVSWACRGYPNSSMPSECGGRS